MEREEKIQSAILDSDLNDLFETLGSFCRGKPYLLLYLGKLDGPVKVGDLASTLHLSPARVSSLLGKLEFERLVRRVKRKFDYRSTYVELTDKGKAKSSEILSAQRHVVHKLIEKVGIDTLERFLLDASNIGRAYREIEKENPACCD